MERRAIAEGIFLFPLLVFIDFFGTCLSAMRIGYGYITMKEVVLRHILHESGIGTKGVVALWLFAMNGEIAVIYTVLIGAQLYAFQHFAVYINQLHIDIAALCGALVGGCIHQVCTKPNGIAGMIAATVGVYINLLLREHLQLTTKTVGNGVGRTGCCQTRKVAKYR